MRYIFLLLFSVVVLSGYSQNTKTVRGIVFDDVNKNGVPDQGETGISNVLVSNQEQVVKTKADGTYEISVSDPSVLFVTKPSGYEVPLNADNLPQFYYIFQPEGSPKLDNAGIKPTGALPAEVNFPLYKVNKKTDFKVLVLADVQTASPTELEYFREDVVSPALNLRFDLALSLGDLVHDNPGLFPEYAASMALLRVPCYNVVGNHDVNYDADELYSDDSFKNLFGPQYYSFDYGDVHFVVLENIERFCKKGDVDAYWDCYRGRVGDKQLDWLKNDLANVPPEKLVVVCQHIAFEKVKGAGERMRVVNRQENFNILKNREHLLILSGHKHTLQHDYFNSDEGWQGKKELEQIVCSAVSGSWWTGPKDERGIPSATQIDGVPNGYFLFEFNGNRFTDTFFPAGDIQEQMRIESPVGNVGVKEPQIVVNVYNSSKYSTVTANIDGGREIGLKNKIMEDPFMVASFKKFRDEYKSWASPSESTQMWVGQLPNGLTKGFHTIRVTSKDEFNRIYISNTIFEID